MKERGNSFSSRKHILNRRQHQHETGPAGITSQHCNQTHKTETPTPEYQGLGSATPTVLFSSAKNRAEEGWKAENRNSMCVDWKEGWVKVFGDPNFISKALTWALGLDKKKKSGGHRELKQSSVSLINPCMHSSQIDPMSSLQTKPCPVCALHLPVDVCPPAGQW